MIILGTGTEGYTTEGYGIILVSGLDKTNTEHETRLEASDVILLVETLLNDKRFSVAQLGLLLSLGLRAKSQFEQDQRKVLAK